MNFGQNSFMDMDDPIVIEGIANQVSEIRHLPFIPEESQLVTNKSDQVSTQKSNLEADCFGISGVVVADTNYLISQLKFFSELVDSADQRGDVLVVIPSVVIWELDGLKTNGSLRGQKLSEVMDTKVEARRMPNYSISLLLTLSNGRYFEAFFSCPLVLLSNDKNLCIKAMVHEIRSCSFWRQTPLELFQEYLPAGYVQKPSINTFSDSKLAHEEDPLIPYEDIDMEDALESLPSRALLNAGPSLASNVNRELATPIVSTSRISGKATLGYTDSSPEEVLLAVNTLADRVCSIQPPVICIDMSPRWDYASNDPLDQLYFVVDVILKQLHVVLASGILTEFESSLGPDWNVIVSKQPPWLIEDLLVLLQKHYHAVFSDTFANKRALDTCVYNISSFLKQWKRLKDFNLGYIYKKDVNRILYDFEYVLQIQRDSPNRNALIFLWSHELSKIECP
ncbi:hypothetical protein K493DRAFT_296832 [Basidiobolus meristosporus CBS 931.73]|uniref:PIN domain-containing protein n=1 Tax=Basidiobolus meristosporus CBS 931.73 TaxID=1314790 RepID=A0A1Y1Z349_9FUNG|nr:hypothetical protein K493DRAFT_296832 [Basidiobolus meristosporus CBS 931.73]|eukprot:ORY04708.1 hypothetical protein K493DRAFT_296832 [Basidiobolus meristosporus CBS 931.73]